MRLATVLLCFGVGCTSAALVAPEKQAVIGWGDSLTFGTGAAPDADYVSDVGRLLNRSAVNAGVPGESSGQILTRIEADSQHRNDVAVLWMGTNNTYQPSDIIRDVEHAITLVGPHYLILPPMNRPYEYKGRAEYFIVTAAFDSLRARHAGHVVDVRAVLIAHADTSAQDQSDKANDVPPSSLRFDTVHLNAAGYAIVARTVADTILAKGW